MPTYYFCNGCGQDLSDWFMQAADDYRCPQCGLMLDPGPVRRAKRDEQIKGAIGFFLLFSILVSSLTWLFADGDILLAVIVGPAVGVVATTALCVAVVRRGSKRDHLR